MKKGLERSSEQYTYEVKPHHYYASSVYTWKTSEDIREVIGHMEKEGHNYTLWYVPVSNEENYDIRWYAPQVEGAFVIGQFDVKKR